MPIITVKFKDFNPLSLAIDDTELGHCYTELVKSEYEKSFPVFRDPPKYTVDYMLQLARTAKESLGWEWSFDHYDIGITALLHKDIERLVGVTGFSNVPEELDNLIHELHYCLHMIQWNKPVSRNGWLQIEWYNDSGFPLDGVEIFQPELKFGDVKLQNPFVGHGPLQMYMEQDFSNIPQTCKFHNFVKPGINISTNNFRAVDPQIILSLFKKHSPEFVAKHGEQKILDYTGYPVIGKVTNTDDLKLVTTAPVLELEYLKFDETT